MEQDNSAVFAQTLDKLIDLFNEDPSTMTSIVNKENMKVWRRIDVRSKH